MSNENLPDFIEALRSPAIYEHKAEDISLVQTHISYVLLAGEYVYKLKKPVNFGFLDFSSLEKRKECCEQELLLNRRLCPDIYLGLVTINKNGDQYSLNGAGEVVEYAVKMARMPEKAMMGKVIEAGKLSKQQIDDLVEVLVPFYEKAERGGEIDTFGSAKGVSVNVLENFEQTEGFIGQGALSREQFDSISGYAKDFLTNEKLFNERIEQGKIRDCHGDLYSANICLADQVYIYDCIEFNQRFRYCDVAADVAFLAMDLDYHGLDELSEYLITRFCKTSADEGLSKMLNFYKCYRAYVRGKIGLFTAGDEAVDPAVREACRSAAAKYFTLAQRYAAAS
ncbi:MAG: hypothetical protein OEM02_14190 [Desulfobulbaceae bacterium]|nr:hypothetical protein [Desulfobulbaceae bacterium]